MGTGSVKGTTCKTVAIRGLTGLGIAQAPAIDSVAPISRSGRSTKGNPLGSKTEVFRRAGWKLRPDRSSSSPLASASFPITLLRSGLPPPRRATSRTTSSTSISDQCPTRAVYKGVENLPAGQPTPFPPDRDDSSEPASLPVRERVTWRSAVTGAASLSTPVAIGMFNSLLGEIIAVAELAMVITVITVALFGSKTLSDRAFRLLRWLSNRAEPPAPH